MRPCGAVERLGTTAEKNLMISIQPRQVLRGVSPHRTVGHGLCTPSLTLGKCKTRYLQLWANFLKVSQEIEMRGLTNNNLEYKGTDHSVYWRFSVFLRFTNIFKRPPIESYETLC